MALQPSREGSIPFTISSIDKSCSTYFKVFGDLSSDATPLVMLHGGPGGGHEYLLPFAQLWPRYGIPVVLYDQIGCAASTHLPETAGDESFWNVDLFIAELNNLLDFLRIGLGYHLLGQSWGGMLAADFAGRRPQGLRRLILASAIASLESNIRGIQILRRDLPLDAQQTLDKAEQSDDWESSAVKEVLAIMGKKHVSRAKDPPPELIPAWKHLSGDKTVYRTMYATSWVAPKGSLSSWSSVPRLPHITAPTLVYNGEHDTSHDVAQVPFFELIPRVRWITFAGAGHFTHLEDGGLREKVVNTVGDFLVQAH